MTMMSAGNVKYVRVLNKDKVYRHIFEAECDVNKSLKKERKVFKPRREPQTAPILKQPVSFTAGDGILSQRQRSWVEANPNEPHVENPTYLRYLRLDEQEKTSKSASYLEAQEVRGLPNANNIGSHSSKSNVLEKIHGNRKERHEAALEDLHQELGIISSDLEPCIIEASQMLKDGFAANDKVDELIESGVTARMVVNQALIKGECTTNAIRVIQIELSQILQSFSHDQELINFTLKDLHELWDKVAEVSSYRQGFIFDLERTLNDIELDRYKRVCETLGSFNATFESIAYLMPSDVHRMMERETEEINSTMICNRRSYADLIATLRKAAVEQERKCYHTWQTRVKTWKELRCREAVDEFLTYMNSPRIKQPPEVLRQLECMRKEQSILNTKRLELLNSLRDMKPPGSTKASVYQWNNALGNVTDKLDKLSRKYKEIVQKEYDHVIEQCCERMDQTKSKLEDEQVVSDEELHAILNESFLPLIGEKKTRYECEMDMFEKTIDNLAIFQDSMIRSMFKFVQGAAHIWDTHEVGLAKQERALQEELEDRRHRHDGANQVKEANLDIVMDRMRQDSSEKALTQSLEHAFSLLEEIQNGYKTFHSAQLECVQKYPQSITEELERYDREVCSYFAVDRNKPAKKQQSRGGKVASLSSKPARGPRETSPYVATLEEVLRTSNGTNFYVITYPGEYGFPESPASTRSMKTSMTFLTDQPDVDDYGTLYTEKILIEEDLFSDLRKHLRMQFLESLEKWKVEAMERANSVVAAKAEELNSELDLRLHLHKPRKARAKQDVHNVRAAELLLHQERVESHSKGILNTLAEFRNRFQVMIEEHNNETEKFKEAVQALEATFTSAKMTHELVAIQDQVSGQVEEYMKIIRSSLRKFRHDLDAMLSSLRNSNARFRKSFKVFSDGGNFSLDEVEDYRKKLERMANKIDHFEGSTMGELEGMESKRLAAAMDYAGKLEDRFKHHLFDLKFVEKVTRWITNTQVKVKSEVAKSNSQAKNLSMNLTKLERHIDAVRNPNLDKEQVSAEDIKNGLLPILKSFIDRAIFLDCLLIDAAASYCALEGEENAAAVAKTTTQQSKPKKATARSKKTTKKTISSEKLESSSNTVPGTETTLPSTSDGRSKTMPIENDRRPTIKHSSHSMPPRTQRSSIRRQSAARIESLTRFDKKYHVFGETSHDEPRHFLSSISSILRHSLEGLLATSEIYYRQKGPRSPTRQEITDNFDSCAIAMIQRLMSYKSQAEDYHNSCIQELRSQLKKLMLLVVQVPTLVVESFVVQHEKETQIFVNKIKKQNEEVTDTLEKRKKQHESMLRPTLGHPKNRDEMEALKQQEKERTELTMKNLKDFMDELKGHEVERAEVFTMSLTKMSTEMLLWFDAIVTVDDVKLGKVERKSKSTKQLLLERTKPPKNEEGVQPEHSTKAAGKWEGLPTNELILTPPNNLTRTPTITTTKTTAAHLAVIQARNNAYKNYKSKFFTCLNRIKQNGDAAAHDEERWQERWNTSLQRIQNLY